MRTPNHNSLLANMKRTAVFAGQFLKKGTHIASFCPSSPWMSRSIVRGIRWQTVRCIVELGAGTGPVTHELVKHGKKTRRVIVENDPHFFEILQQRFPDEDIVHGSAADLDKILHDRGIEHGGVDHVISGLPCPSIPKDVVAKIMHDVGLCLVPGGSMRQLTMFPVPFYAGFYRQYFDDVRMKLELLNLPPGGVYICRLPKG
jgi:ornithine lipid N-methyltransferase